MITKRPSRAMAEFWAKEGVPDRPKALLIGLIGGAVGMLAARYYADQIMPLVFAETNETPGTALATSPLTSPEPNALEALGPQLDRQYELGKSASAAVGRIAYQQLNGERPAESQRAMLAMAAQLAAGLAAGAAYGGSRTSTQNHDFAAGTFYEIRLWLADELFIPRLGLRAQPSAFPLRRHLQRLTIYEVYSFTTANVTRFIYWLLFVRR